MAGPSHDPALYRPRDVVRRIATGDLDLAAQAASRAPAP